MNFFLGIIVLGFLWCNVTVATVLTDPNEIFKAKINIRQGKSYNGKTGYIFQWGKEKYPSKFPIILLLLIIKALVLFAGIKKLSKFSL